LNRCKRSSEGRTITTLKPEGGTQTRELFSGWAKSEVWCSKKKKNAPGGDAERAKIRNYGFPGRRKTQIVKKTKEKN